MRAAAIGWWPATCAVKAWGQSQLSTINGPNLFVSGRSKMFDFVG